MTRLIPFLLFIWILLFALSGLTSCKDTLTNSSSEIVFPNDSISFTKHVGPLLQQRCTGSGCHGGSTPAADLNLEYTYSYSALKNRPGLIIPGDAEHSLLVQCIEGKYNPMPPANFAQLTQNQITGIKKWINEGAAFN